MSGPILHLTVSKKLALGFGIITLGCIGLVTVGSLNSLSTKEKALHTKDKSMHYAILAKDIQLHTIQVQQWLTDISATRGLPGFDDGFSEAEDHARGFRSKAAEFRKMFAATGNGEAVSAIDSLVISFDAYYVMGMTMAREYISKGPEAGNVFMRTFDPYAAKLSGQVERLVTTQTNELETNMTSISTSAQSLANTLFIVGILIVAASIFTGTMVTRSIIKPLTIVLKSIGLMGAGDLRTKTHITSHDEFGRIGRSLDTTIENLNGVVLSIKSSTEIVASSASELSATSTQIAANTKEMSIQSTTVASAADQATANIKSLSSAAEEMSSSAQSVAAAIAVLSSSLAAVTGNCQKELKMASDANTHARNSKEKMDLLSSSTRAIGKVLEVINDIADQTNLLALNATIEAASAGEAGKGFSVVANEVKELAKQTAQATQEIENQIEEMRTCTLAAVKAIDLVTSIIQEVNQISQTIVSAVEEQSATVNEIAGNVDHVNQGAQEVARSVSESARGLSEIAENISGVSSAATDTARGVAQVKESSRGLAELSEGLRVTVSRFKLASTV